MHRVNFSMQGMVQIQFHPKSLGTKGFVHLLFNFYGTSVSRIRLQRSRKGRKSSGQDWSSVTHPNHTEEIWLFCNKWCL